MDKAASNAGELRGRILTPQGWVEGVVRHEDGRIVSVQGRPSEYDPSLPCILPGFVDLHVHGGAGVDIMEAGKAAQMVARLHAQHGTTSMLGTTMTAPEDDIAAALAALGDACRERRPGCARLLGVHLEGPYLNPDKLGAQPNQVCTAVMEQFERFRALAPIRVVTLAPEMPGHLDIVRQMSALGIRVQIGHSKGSYEEGVAAMHAGAVGFTHLFNGMSGMHHREPGMAGAALAHAEYAELIPDLVHVHPGAIHGARRAIPRLYCVTDSTAAAGMPDGTYKLGSQTVYKCMGGVRLADGSLAGSALTMDQALRNLVKIGVPVADASDCLSRYPADYLGLHDRGRIVSGAWADIVVLGSGMEIADVYVEGMRVESFDGADVRVRSIARA